MPERHGRGLQIPVSVKESRSFSCWRRSLMSGVSGDASVGKSTSEATEASLTYHEATTSVQQVALAEMDKMIMELSNNYAILSKQTEQAFSNFRKILDLREKEIMSTHRTTFDHKLSILTKHRGKMVAALASQSSLTNSPLLPSQMAISGRMFCGFVPEMTNLVQSTACLILEHREEVGLGTETKASVVGSINTQGIFWVRVLPDKGGIQDIMLQNLSNTIGVELSLSPPCSLKTANNGDICCALYAEDQRWYRARIVEVLNKLNARVYFVDYGNIETIAFSNLCALHPKFLVYPFQMIQCCFSNDPEFSYERELRWKFTDLTHGSNLSVKILELLPSNMHGLLYCVELINHTAGGGEPFEVGTIITIMARPSVPKPQSSNSVKYRDLRCVGKLPNQQTVVTAHAPEVTPSAMPKPTKGVSRDGKQEGLKGNGPSPIPKPTNGEEVMEEKYLVTEKEAEILSEGYFTTSSENSLSISTISSETQMTTPRTSVKIMPTNGSRIDTPTSRHSYSISDPVGSVGLDEDVGVQNSCVTSDVASEVSVKDGTKLLPGDSNDVNIIAPETLTKLTVPNNHAAVAQSSSLSPAPNTEVLIPSPSVDGLESGQRLKSREASPMAVVGACVSRCTLKEGDDCDVFVTTPISEDGTFYAQLTSAEEPLFVEMVDRLQKFCTEQYPTPVFFNRGDLCAAQFSEDECWYRAHVEDIIKNQFMVRYLDFGNQELRERDNVMVLLSEFREIPFQALWCSIATLEHTSFTEKEMKCFNDLTSSQKLTATVVAMEEGQAIEVQLRLVLDDIGVVNLNDEVYMIDFKVTESLNFFKKELVQNTAESDFKVTEVEDFSKKELVQNKVESPNASGFTIPSFIRLDSNEMTSATNWADFMDKIQSPKNDGIFTIPGQEKGSPRLTPTPSSPFGNTSSPQITIPSPPLNHAPSRLSSIPTYSSCVKNSTSSGRKSGLAWSNSPKSVTSSSGHGSSIPRIQTSALDMVRKNLPISENVKAREKKSRSDQVARDMSISDSAGMETLTTNRSSCHASLPESSSSFSSTVIPPGLPEPKGIRSLSQITRNGTSFPPSGRRRKSPDPDSTQVKLFVRYMPHNKSMEEVYHLFSLYGHIHTLEYHSEHKDKLYLIMDKEGGLRAVKGLDGNHMVGSPKPLSVQQYKGSSSQSLEQAELDSLPSHTSTRLFVKNIPLDRTIEEICTVFSQYGKVLGLVPIPSRKNVVYMYMEPKAADLAIDQLHGKAISKNSKPMIVEISNLPRFGRC